MPFTLSHAAAALPFRGTRLDMSAVVAGCFAPDFEYFFRFGPKGSLGHSLPGLFLVDLPVAFVLLWLYHRFVKEPMAAALPQSARRRLQLGPRSLSIRSFPRLWIILLSILVGEATHMVWDWFTHASYWPYEHWSLLRRTAQLPWFGPRQYCSILEYVSSLAGVAIILAWSIHWYRSSPPIYPDFDPHLRSENRITLLLLFALALAAGLVRAAASGIPRGVQGLQKFMAESAVTSITVFWMGVVVYGFLRNILGTRSKAPE